MATARRVAPPSLLCGLAATLSSATRVAGCLEMTHAVATLRRCGHSAENVRAPRRRCPRRRACVSTSPSGPRGGCRPRCASVCWSGSEAPSPRAANCCSRATRRDRRRGACCTRSIVPAATCCSSPAATAGAQPGARPRAAAGGGGRGGRRTRRKSTISPRPFTTHPRADSSRRHGRQASVEPREYVDRRSLPETEGKRHERVREKRQHGRKKESRASRRVAFE
mmetsp:Transcript_50309/g.163009  ORF Transcript_50309/g.163009 Transcript_50309/m.163009 type:complete len:224 (+) Transcript_50309:182-853(+)